MSLLQTIWTVSIIFAIWALITVAALVVLRLFRERHLRSVTRAREVSRALVTAYSDGIVSEKDVEQRLGNSGFVAVALDLLMVLQGEPRDRLIALMKVRGVDARLRRGLLRLNQAKRVAAAEVLYIFPGDETTAALFDALQDRDKDVRLAAASSLVKMGSAPSFAFLLPLLIGKDGAMPVRLGQILRDYCDADMPAVSAVAWDRQLHPFVRAKAVETLAATGDQTAVSMIQNLVLDEEPDLRAATLRALGKLQSFQSAAAIAAALRDEVWFVRAAAADSAARLALYELAPLIVPLMEDEQWWVRFRAGEALTSLDAAGRKALRDIASDRKGRKRTKAAARRPKSEVA
jgi:hypothetical protein